MSEDRGGPGVPFPPPFLFIGLLGLGLVLGRRFSFREEPNRTLDVVSVAAVVGGAAICAGAAVQMKRGGASLTVYHPTEVLVTGGFFRFSRNPIYFGLTSVYLGIAMRARSLPAFVLLPVALALTDRLVVDPEERYLEATFGKAYRKYKRAVPRWF